MKKVNLMIVIFIILLFQGIVYAGVDVQLNGKIIDFTDENGNKVEAQIINNRTMVPMRKIFELLDCNVEWEGISRKVTATKGETVIQLQIDSKDAYKKEGASTSQISLDTAPVIIDNRTMVPLRFIAESLGKQVGWDSSSYTAVIIDYSYFENELKKDAPLLFDLLEDESDYKKNIKIELVRDYYDDTNGLNNNKFKVDLNVIEKGDIQNVSALFSGTNDLINDMQAEQWSDISYITEFKENEVIYKTSDEILSKIFEIGGTGYGSETYDSLKLNGGANISTEKFIQVFAGVDENKITVETFRELNSSYKNLIRTFVGNNNSCTFSIDADNCLKNQYFNLTTLDNFVFDNSISKIYNFINKKIFNYDVIKEELFYDNSFININGKIEISREQDIINSTKIEINYKSSNKYDERIEYKILILINKI